MQVAGDAAALVLLGRHHLAQQVDDVQLRRLVGLDLRGQLARALGDADLERPLRIAQRLRGLLLPGQVARDLGEPERRASPSRVVTPLA